MEGTWRMFIVLGVLVLTMAHVTDSQCTCSCSSLGSNQETCDGSAHTPEPLPPQGSGNVSNPGTCQCPDQGDMLSILKSLQGSVTSLKEELAAVTRSVWDLRESIPETLHKQLNISWTVSPGVNDPNTSYPGDIIWEGVHRTHPRDCEEIRDAGDSHGDGLYRIYNEGQDEFNNVRCNMDCDGGGWLVVMRRFDGSVDFNRTWADYVKGFGDLKGEFWMGLDFLHNMTNLYRSMVVRLDLVTYEDDHKYVQYTNFWVGDKSTNYKLSIGTYSGSAGTSFAGGSGKYFSTYDTDHDAVSNKNCAYSVGGGWWFYAYHTCGYSWPTGKIDETLINAKSGGIAYGSSTSTFVVYKEVTMKIRPAFQQP